MTKAIWILISIVGLISLAGMNLINIELIKNLFIGIFAIDLIVFSISLRQIYDDYLNDQAKFRKSKKNNQIESD